MESIASYTNSASQFLNDNFAAIAVGVVSAAIFAGATWATKGAWKWLFLLQLPKWRTVMRQSAKSHIRIYIRNPSTRAYYEKLETQWFRLFMMMVAMLILATTIETAQIINPEENTVLNLKVITVPPNFGSIMKLIGISLVGVIFGYYCRYGILNRTACLLKSKISRFRK